MGKAESIEVSAGGFVISQTDSESVALMARFNRGGKLEWCVPKGHPENDEDVEQAAVREVFEETGLRVEILEGLGEVQYQFNQNGINIKKTVHLFLMKQIGGELSLEHDPHHEASDLAWVKIDDLINKLSHRNEQRIAQLVIERIRSRG